MRRNNLLYFILLPGWLYAATIGIVRDGPDSWYFEDQIQAATAELENLIGEKINPKAFDGQWRVDQIRAALLQAMQDPAVDVIYAAGVVSSMLAQAMPAEQRTKPVFGGAVHYSDVRDFPISKQGTSSVPNFAFISSPQRVSADLRQLVRLKNTQTVHVFMDQLLFDNLPRFEETSAAVESEAGVTLKFVVGADTAASYLDKLPATAEAVYVSLLSRMSTDERKALYAGLQARKKVNLAMMGELEMGLGAMSGLGTDTRKPVSRRIALSLYHLLQGGQTTDLRVILSVQDRLIINLPVARAIGYSTDYDTALVADLQESGVLQGGEALDLAVAMELAAEQNIEALIAQDELEAQRASERRARGNLLPGLSLEGEYGRTEIDGKIDPMGPDEVEGGSYGVELRQILFNDAAWSGHQAARAITRATELAGESARLDAMQEAGVAFLQLLLNQKLYAIEKDNLRLTRNNLEFARLRLAIQATDKTEVYRWESNEARDLSNLFRQDGAVRDALAELNRVLGFPQDQTWKPVDLALADKEFFFLDKDMPDRETTFEQFERFRDYVMQRAVEDSPELKRFDQTLLAQGITLRQLERKRFVPEVSGLSTWSVNPQDSNLTETQEQDEWFIGLVARFPLFEGGGIKAQADEERANLRVLHHQREQAMQLIEQRAVSAWNGMGALHPAIRLSGKALDAATANFEAVHEKYTEGQSTILDLLDAQSQLQLQKQQQAQALYSYLINMIQLQRVIAWFEHEQSPQAKQAWAKGLRTYMKHGRNDPR